MARKEIKTPYRIRHSEKPAFMAAALGDFSKGDVVVREGTPCLLVSVSAGRAGEGMLAADEGKVWVTNLLNGSTWQASARDQVYPAFDVALTFESTRWQS